MSSMASDGLPSVGFLARYLADAAKQRHPARGVATVLQSYVERGLPADRIAHAVVRARVGLPKALHPLLEEYARMIAAAGGVDPE